MEPKYLAFRFGDCTPLAHHLTFGEPGSLGIHKTTLEVQPAGHHFFNSLVYEFAPIFYDGFGGNFMIQVRKHQIFNGGKDF